MAFVFDINKIEPGAFHFNEWVETDGTGGWASSTLSGSNSRRYHGLLVSPSVSLERLVLLSKLEATLVSQGQRFDLSYNAYGDGYTDDQPPFLQSFVKDLFPQWTYKAGGVHLKKTVCAIQGQNTILVQFQVLEASEDFVLELLPLVAGRKYHSLVHANSYINKEAFYQDDSLHYKPYGEETLFYIGVCDATYTPNPLWYYNFYFKEEQDRGQDYNEDLFTPGLLSLTIHAGQTVWLKLSTEDPSPKNAAQLFSAEKQRRLLFLKDLAVDELSVDLILAADQFIIKTKTGASTVIAGYHWFSDWGRDTMIALEGLCLVTKRFSESRSILENFASRINKGIIPNRFEDGDNVPAFNTVDATLWFFVACFQYNRYTNDKPFISSLLPVFGEIISWHLKGTWYNIHTDTDSLLYAGEPGVQLTWMDAKVGDWVVTPRMGKAVEVNALWYNALKIYAGFLAGVQQPTESAKHETLAETVKTEFIRQFWFEDGNYLYDYIDGGHRDTAFRPNQLFAISLPFPLLGGDMAEKVLAQIEQKLYVPKGLRSLAPGSEGYRPWYFGNTFERDGAYHQGTAWSWLLGPYIDALVQTRGDDGRKAAQKVIQDFMPHLNEAGIGSVSEIFDATYPYYPKGCIAQAWGVSEILRVYMNYKLYR